MGRAPDSNLAAYAPKRAPLGKRLRVPAGAQIVQFPVESGGTRPAIVAAAQVLSRRKLDRTVKRAPAEAWQSEVWALRDETGELRFIGDRQARACAQARVFVGKKPDPSGEPEPVTDGIGAQLAQALFAATGMIEQTIRRAAQHLIYNGETLLVVREDDDGQLELSAHSVSELTGSPGRWKLSNGIDKPRDVGDDEIVIRCWTPHPEWSARADAPVRAVLPIARELRGLSQYVSAQVDSRLAGAGILLVPQEIESMQSQADDDGEDPLPFADELTEYLMTPVADRDSAAAIVPFMATVPAELLDKIKHISFATPLDEHAPALREECIRRIGLGMDSDPSVLLGQASSNHWSAWAVDENEIKFGVQPIVATICHALTVGLLRPLLVEQSIPDPDLYSVWFDTTPLLVRPDRSKDAQALFDKGVISAAILRRENGFDDSDAPDAEEIKDKVVRDLIGTRSDLIDKLLPQLGIIIPGITDNAERVDDTLAEEDATVATDTAPAGESTPAVAPEPPNAPPVMGETEATQ
ncbi:hypothetical protein JVX90_00245 [Gordonia sp. PDNC005]|uniref:hypothetical protein n=1 Tax=Gordonia sp. PDNC005 TaxID=2811424 RepID=UPI001965D682|nr:hypothetical protein [Gordonia sp. PDNC005]QRY62742.1 hypothetical protein JVX90_00245 [Gordonia sp. PDNC005]